MKNNSIKPVQGKPTASFVPGTTGDTIAIDTAPFLSLFEYNEPSVWWDMLDEIMLAYIESQQKIGLQIDGEVLYEYYFSIRLLRDVFKECVKDAFRQPKPASDAQR